MKKIKGSLGNCPQHDSYPVVFPDSHDHRRSEGSGGVHAGTGVIDLQGKRKQFRLWLTGLLTGLLH